ERDKEIALALSACPPAVGAKAAVYVLEKAGYVKVRESENGFTAIVQHSLPTSQEPQCMDAEAAPTFLPRMLNMAELRAQGKSRERFRRSLPTRWPGASSPRRHTRASTTCCRPRTAYRMRRGSSRPFRRTSCCTARS